MVERGGGVITKISYLCYHYNGLLLHFITHCFLLIACFRVGIVYIPVKKLIFKIRTNNQKISRKHVDIGTKRPKRLKLISKRKMDRAGDYLYPLRLNHQLQYHWWVYSDIIFRYLGIFFGIPKLLWDDINICSITGGWILVSSLDIQKCFWYS